MRKKMTTFRRVHELGLEIKKRKDGGGEELANMGRIMKLL